MAERGPRRLIARWERYWFETVPADSYAALRILFGLLGLASVASLIPVSTFWTLDGLVPLPGGGIGVRSAIDRLGWGAAAGWILFVSLITAFVCMAIGYRSRVVVPLCFVLSLLHQNFWSGLPLSGANRVILLVLFYLAWVDCGGRASVDAWLASRRSAWRPRRVVDGRPIWPLRLIRAHVALIYFTTGLWKLTSDAWRDGSAIHYVLHLNTFARFPYSVPSSLEWIATVATYTTLFWELAFPFLLLHARTRRGALALGVFLHVGMVFTMELALFSWVMIASYVAFLDPHRVHGWGTRLLSAPRGATARARQPRSTAAGGLGSRPDPLM